MDRGAIHSLQEGLVAPEDEGTPGGGRAVAPGTAPLGESSREPPMVVGAEERVKRATKDVVPRGGRGQGVFLGGNRDAPHVMALSSPGLEVQDTHAWLLAGHRSAEDVRQKGWPRVSPRPTPPVGTVPPIGRCHAVAAVVPTFSWLPENYGILHDASWCPKTRRCGGAVAVFCPVTLRYQVYPVPIPLRLDNAYTAELYTAWVILTARGPSSDPAFGFRSDSWHFALQRVHHGPGGAPRTIGLTPGRPRTYPCPRTPLPDGASPRPDIVTLNVQMSLRPKLRALDVLIREYQYPLTLHVQEAGPPVVQQVHPLYHTIQAPAKVAGGCATLLYRAPDLTVTGHNAHPSGRALITHFTMACVAHCHANVYFPADGDLDMLQDVLDWVYPYLLHTPARVVVLTGDLNANCHWVPHLPVSPAPLCDLVLPTLAHLGMRRLHPLAEAPTWVSPQGFAGALDHISPTSATPRPRRIRRRRRPWPPHVGGPPRGHRHPPRSGSWSAGGRWMEISHWWHRATNKSWSVGWAAHRSPSFEVR